MRPLEGIKVVDFTHAYSAVYASMLFADLGAEVTKIELHGGEQSRGWMPFVDGKSAYFCMINRNKKNIEINLKSEEGKQIVRDLVKDADIVIENFRNGVMDKLGLGYEELKKINPGIIYGSLNGYGSKGPLSHLKAYDNIASAYSGVVSATGKPDGTPYKLGICIGDCYVGLNLFSAFMMALYHKKETGEGQRVEVAMLDSLFTLLDKQMLQYSVEGKVPNRDGNAYTQFAPEDVFDVKDGYVTLSVRTEEVWKTFCNTINKPEWLTDKRFTINADRKANYSELKPLIDEVFAGYGKLELQELLMKQDVPCAASMKVSDIKESRQYIERGMIRYQNDVQVGTFLAAGIPCKFSDTVCDVIKTSKFPGQDTVKILKDLGYSDEKVAELKAKKIV